VEGEDSRGGIVAGAILILIGIAALAQQLLGGFGDSLILFAIGGALLAGYFTRRNYGLLIPGCILLGIALGSVGQETVFTVGDFGAIGLGMGFLAIYLIDLAYSGETHWWPLVPGGVMVVTGIAQGSKTFERLLTVGWPLILVLVGLIILAGATGLTGQGEPDEPEPR
jgi:hypothetical protein